MIRKPAVGQLAELFALTAFAVGQPLFDVTGDSPDFFLFRQAGTFEIITWALLVVLVPPLILWGVEAVVGLWSERVARAVHVAFIGVLASIVALEALKSFTGLRGSTLAGLSVALGAGVAWLIVRRGRVREWVRFAAPAPLIFLALFLAFSPVAKLVVPGAGGVAALASTEARAPVVMVVLDELPLSSLVDTRGQIEDRLYPNFAGLAASSTWYRNATAVAGFTPRAIPSILTGQFPPEGKVAPAAVEYPDNLFTLLADSHDLEVLESLTALCPSDLCEGSSVGPQGVGALVRDGARVWRRIVALDDVEEDPTAAWLLEDTVVSRVEEVATEAERPDGGEKFAFGHRQQSQPTRFAEFLDAIDGSGRPFHFLHLLLPHTPWRFFPDGTTYDAPMLGMDGDGQWEDAEWPIEIGRQRHLLQTVYTDRLLGRVIDRLEETGLWERAVVVVTADHGYAFRPGRGQKPKEMNMRTAHEVMPVPLFVKAPGQGEGAVRHDNAMLVDVAPTVAELVGARIPWPVDGISLVSERRRSATKVFVNNPENPRRIDGSGLLARAVADGVDAHVPVGEGIGGLFRLGPFGEFVGEDVDDVPGLAPIEADIDRGDLPGLVVGQLAGVGDGQVVAVAVDGRVAGFSATWTEDGDRGTFAVLVAPQLVRGDVPEVSVYRVDPARLGP